MEKPHNSHHAFAVLGLNDTADAQQVHQAYRTLVKAWHPDRFPEGEQQREAQEKLIELNLAYEEALKITSHQHQPAYHTISCEEAKSTALRLIEEQRYETALLQLSRTQQKDDEWFYLEGRVLMGMRQYDSAQQAFQQAVRLDGSKREYRAWAFDAAIAVKRQHQLRYRVSNLAEKIMRFCKREDNR